MRHLRFGLIILLLFAACGGDSRVGSGVALDELDDDAASLRDFLDESDPGEEGGGFLGTPEDQAAAEQGGGSDAAAEEHQRALEEREQEQRERFAVEFAITQAGFEPYYITVYQGGVIKVVNHDSRPRSVTGDQGEFDSGDIPPGGEWFFEANTVGRFNFHDATRPYVVGTLEVLPR